MLDLLLGDPEYRAHPVRLIGLDAHAHGERAARSGFDGYGGGIALFLILALVWAGGVSLAVAAMPAGAASLSACF